MSADCTEDTVVTAGENSLWVFSGSSPREIAGAGGEPIRRIAISTRGDMVAIAYGSRIRLVDLMTGRLIATFSVYSAAERLTFSLDDAFLITAHEDNVARLWNLIAEEPVEVARLLESGRAAEQAGDIDQAGVWYQRAIDTGAITGLLDLARIAERAGDRGRAQQLTERWGPELLIRLSPSSNAAIAYAEGLRRALGQDMVRMDHLLLGLSEKEGGPFQRLLNKAGIRKEGLLAAMGEPPGTPSPFSLVSSVLNVLPPTSEHVTQALDRAAEAAERAGSSVIHSRYILYGALSVTESSVIKVLASVGVSLSGIEDLDTFLAQQGASAPRPVLLAGAAADTVPKPGAQRVRKADRLDVAADMEMLVSVLLARDTPLPLAVGLFGDWGSGKSFFMAFMEERVAELSALARQGKPEAHPYCREVRQLRFNAWHYVDANLWASLAATLFDQLARADAPTSTQVKLTELGQAREKAREAQEERQLIEHDIARLAADTDRVSTVIRVSAAVAIRAVRPDPRLRAELRRAARQEEGEEEASAATTQLVSALGEIDTTARKAKVTWRLFEEEVLHRRSRTTLITLLVLIGAGIIASAAVSLPVSVKILTFAGAVAAGLSPALAGALRVLYLAREAREARELPLVKRLDDLARAQTAEQEAQWSVAQHERELAALRDKGLLLQEFVRGRATSLDYRGKLGVISQVRYDFEELVGMLPDELGADQLAAVRDKVSTLVPEVDRIILYIDDLDRCPPDKVVEVLQAVHLLLAFPLFVVVVGVDSRWLERSLRAHYRDLLEEPDSYLEKIFQIPFMLQQMTMSQRQDLVDVLLVPPRESGRRQAGPLLPEAGGRVGDIPDVPGTPDVTEQAGNRPEQLAASTAPGPSSATLRPPRSGTSQAAAPAPPPLPRPQALEVSGPERELLGRAGVIVPTPRAVKRLVNIYRMLRVSVPEDELQAFMPEGGDEYQAVILLLAILVGRPAAACEIFGKLAVSGDDDIWELFSGIGDVHETLTGLRDHITVTQAAVYRRWAARVARFSFRFPAIGAPGRRASQ